MKWYFSKSLGPPLEAHGLGAAADWTWRGKLDLVCDGPGVYVGSGIYDEVPVVYLDNVNYKYMEKVLKTHQKMG